MHFICNRFFLKLDLYTVEIDHIDETAVSTYRVKLAAADTQLQFCKTDSPAQNV